MATPWYVVYIKNAMDISFEVNYALITPLETGQEAQI